MRTVAWPVGCFVVVVLLLRPFLLWMFLSSYRSRMRCSPVFCLSPVGTSELACDGITELVFRLRRQHCGDSRQLLYRCLQPRRRKDSTAVANVRVSWLSCGMNHEARLRGPAHCDPRRIPHPLPLAPFLFSPHDDSTNSCNWKVELRLWPGNLGDARVRRGDSVSRNCCR